MSPELAFELHTAQNVEMQKLARRQGLARSTASAGIRSHTIGQNGPYGCCEIVLTRSNHQT
jgi:hypothetical protein